MHEKNIAAIYKKVKLYDNIYIYRFIEAVEDVEYDVVFDTIKYMKKGDVRELYNIEDENFTISDEKYCFSDLLSKESLKEMYNIEDDEIKERFIEECCTFIRYGVFDDVNETLKIIDSDIDKIKNAKPESHFQDYFVSYKSDIGTEIILSLDTANDMLEKLNNGNIVDVQNFLNNTVTAAIDIENSCSLKEEKVNENNSFKKEENVSLNEDLNEKLNKLIGLKNLKKEILKLNNYLIFNDKVKDELELDKPHLNMVFQGNPGTGKTTVAKIVAKMFYNLGYAKTDKVVEVTAQDFVAEYVGQTAGKAREVIKKNKGGVIFIDEAYVFSSDGQAYAQEALVEILKEMEKGETIFIFAGYKEEMEKFIKMNPGLQSRVSYYLNFPDYTLDELYEIFKLKIRKAKINLDENAEESIKMIISNFMKKEHFGNGRFIDKLFDKIILNHADKCYNTDDLNVLTTISAYDIDNNIEDELDVKQKVKKIGF